MFRKERYYVAPEDNDSDALEDRKNELLNTKYDITQKFSLFAEGISECSKADQESIMIILQGNVDTIDFKQLGRKLWDVSFSYSESLAENDATDDLVKGNLE